MAFHKKLPALKSMAPEVAVIGECASPDVFTSKARGDRSVTKYFDQMEWTGINEHKGLAAFCRRGYSMRVDPSHDASLKYILPLHVDGPVPFKLLAVWAQNMNDGVTRKDQPGPFRMALDHYAEFLSSGPVVIAGDFNNSVIWDKPGWPINQATANDILDGQGIVSAYHELRNESHGSESFPTLYWRDRKLRGPRYHLDFVYAPREWLPLSTLEVGSFRKWTGTGLSDHVPLRLTYSPKDAKAS